MNLMTFEKKIAQMERKRLHKQYGIWVYPQSDFGERVLKSPEGIYFAYNIYYDDSAETEEERIQNANSVAKEALAYQSREFFRHPNVGPKFKIGLINVSKDVNREMKEGIDYEMQITQEDLAAPEPLTFDDIKAL